MASTYYDSSGKEVADGEIAYASDLNDINTSVDTAFQQVELAIDTISANQSYYSDLAEQWATEVEDTEVTTGKYSALHYAAKAEDQAVLADADRVQTNADRVQTGLDRVQTGADKVATAADRVQTGLDKAATAADRVQTGLDVTAASGYASSAAASAAVFPTLGSGDQGKYLRVATPYTNGIETAAVDLSTYAPLNSPTLTGTPAAPTASAGTNTTQIATTAFVTAAATLPKAVQVFTSSGTYTKTSGATVAIVELVGGGGSGGGSGSGLNASGGGGAGGYSRKRIALAAVTTVSVTVGAGGASVTGANPGNAGGTTSFGSHCSATGGAGGPRYVTGGSAAGGVGSNGDINIYGGCGAPPGINEGGASFFGGGNKRGSSHGAYGAGGQGAIESEVNSASGASGIVIVTEY